MMAYLRFLYHDEARPSISARNNFQMILDNFDLLRRAANSVYHGIVPVAAAAPDDVGQMRVDASVRRRLRTAGRDRSLASTEIE